LFLHINKIIQNVLSRVKDMRYHQQTTKSSLPRLYWMIFSQTLAEFFTCCSETDVVAPKRNPSVSDHPYQRRANIFPSVRSIAVQPPPAADGTLNAPVATYHAVRKSKPGFTAGL
jgi:hypothetical protein